MNIGKRMQSAASNAEGPDHSYKVTKIPYEDLNAYWHAYTLYHPNAIQLDSNKPMEFFSNHKDYVYSYQGDLMTASTSTGTNVKFAPSWSDSGSMPGNILERESTYIIEGARLNPARNKVYELTGNGNYSFYQYTWNLYQYDLSTAGDLASAGSGTNVISDFGGTTNGMPLSFAFNSSGTKVYLLRIDNTIYQYSLSTAYDLTSTVTDDSKTLDISTNVSSPNCIELADSDTQLLVGHGTNIAVYDLSTAGDISTGTYNSGTSGSGFNSKVGSISFNSNGTVMFLCRDSFSSSINKYTLSTAWDVSTATYDSGIYNGDSTINRGAFYYNSGSTVLFFGSSRIALEELATAYTLPEIKYFTSVSIPSGNILDIRVGNSDAKVYVSSSSGYIYQYSNSNNKSTGLTYDNKSLNVSSHMTTYSVDGGRFCISANGTKVVHLNGNTVKQWTLSTAWDISTGTLDGSYSLPSLPTIPNTDYQRGILVYATDGSQLYVFFGTSATTASLYVYDLSTNWDASTATFSYSTVPPAIDRLNLVRLYPHENSTSILYGLGNNNSLCVWLVPTANDLTSCGWYGKIHHLGRGFFNDAEDKFYFTDSGTSYNTKKLRSLTLSTPSDLNTASLDSEEKELFYGYVGADFRSYDDTNVYLVSSSGAKAYTATMSTSGDLSTLTLTETWGFALPSYRASTISRDGENIYHTYSLSYLYKTPLSTAWDVSTAGTTTGTLSLGAFTNSLHIDGPSESRDDYLFSSMYDGSIRRRPKDSSDYWLAYDQQTNHIIWHADDVESGINTTLSPNAVQLISPFKDGTRFLTQLQSMMGTNGYPVTIEMAVVGAE